MLARHSISFEVDVPYFFYFILQSAAIDYIKLHVKNQTNDLVNSVDKELSRVAHEFSNLGPVLYAYNRKPPCNIILVVVEYQVVLYAYLLYGILFMIRASSVGMNSILFTTTLVDINWICKFFLP